MRSNVFRMLVFAACAAMYAALIGCATQTAGSPDGPGASEQVAGPTIEEQIALLAGRDAFELEPIDGAEAWLGDDRFAAYIDTLTHDEFIVDTETKMVLAFDRGTHIYQEPIDLAPYPGEPSREEMLALADDFARENVPDRDISTMRRTAWRRVCGIDTMGDTLEYQVMYRRYVNGVKVPEYASVTVFLPSWTWTPSLSAHEGGGDADAPPEPQVTMLEALDTAASESGFGEYSVKELSLSSWNGEYFWSFELENLNVPENSFGGHAAWVRIDATTGECIEVAGCG